MKIYTDEKMIQRNKKIGSILKWVSLIIMVGGMIIVFQPNLANNPTLTTVVFSIVIVGFFLSSISNYLTSRFGQDPRPDELISKSLKGLDDRYSLYHYVTPISHLLIGPAGLWSISPSFIDGSLEYNEKRNTWRRKGGSFINKFIAQESLGNPQKELQFSQRDLDKYLKKNNIEMAMPLQGVVLLLNKGAKLEDENKSDILIIKEDKFKEKIRRMAKDNPIGDEQIERYNSNFSIE